MKRQVGMPIEILLVEDSPSDAMMTREVLEHSKLINSLHVVEDGVQAIDYLRKRPPYENAPRPDMILLDLNLPKKSGREVLAEVKGDDDLKMIPVVVLTTSKSDEDVGKSYSLHANCYITKPVEFDEFAKIIRRIQNFWFCVVTLPKD